MKRFCLLRRRDVQLKNTDMTKLSNSETYTTAEILSGLSISSFLANKDFLF